MINLLIADDHAVVRKGLRLLFKQYPDMNIVDEAIDGEDALYKLRANQVDIVLLDIDMPKMNGITAIRHIRKEIPRTKILILSMHPEKVYAISALKAGASGFVSKEADTETIINAIRKIHEGGIYISNELAQKLAFDENAHRPSRLYKKLSTREIEVLKLLSAGKRNKEIAEELDINEKTVSTYKARLLKKLDVTNMVELINHAKNLDMY
jgi:DNA-binding NarL/FixJ family response regulator